MQLPIGRLLSVIVAVAYILIGAFASQPRSVKQITATILIICGYLILPLACIWFGDEMGDYIGTFSSPPISKRTPGCFVQFGGWLLLLLPVLFSLLWILR